MVELSEAAKKWADSQGLPYDDERVLKYAAAMGGRTGQESDTGSEPIDLMEDKDFVAGRRAIQEDATIVDDMSRLRQAITAYAEQLNTSFSDPRVANFERGLHSLAGDEHQQAYEEGREWGAQNKTQGWSADDVRFREAVEKYARSQGLPIDHPRVIKYARGLKSLTGDFGGRQQSSPVGRRT